MILPSYFCILLTAHFYYSLETVGHLEENLLIYFVISTFLTLAVVVWNYYWGDMSKYLLTPDRESIIDQRPFWWTTEFLGSLLRGIWVGWLFIRSEMTQRQLYHKKPIPVWVTALESWKAIAYHKSQQIGGCSFWAAWLVSAPL